MEEIKALNSEVIVVTKPFIFNCVIQEKVVDTADYLVSPVVADKKRKADDDEGTDSFNDRLFTYYSGVQ